MSAMEYSIKYDIAHVFVGVAWFKLVTAEAGIFWVIDTTVYSVLRCKKVLLAVRVVFCFAIPSNSVSRTLWDCSQYSYRELLHYACDLCVESKCS